MTAAGTLPVAEALALAARIADADDADCEALLHRHGPEVCAALRCEVLHQAEVIERRTAELSTATGEIARLRAALAVAREIIVGRAVAPTDEEIDAHAAAGGSWMLVMPYTPGFRPGWRRRLEVHTIHAADMVRTYTALNDDRFDRVTWIALGPNGHPCEWPVTEARHG